MFTDQDLDHVLTRWWQESQRTRYTLSPHPDKYRVKDERRNLANDIEAEAAIRLQALGFYTRPQKHKSHFDLLAVCDDGALRVEVKASRWDGSRYQFNLRDNDADVLVLACVDGCVRFFVIPFNQVKGKTVIKVTQHDPSNYVGKLIVFYEAWDILPDLARKSGQAFQRPYGVSRVAKL